MKKIIAILLAMVMLLGLLSGCGQEAATDAPETAAPAESKAPEAAPEEETPVEEEPDYLKMILRSTNADGSAFSQTFINYNNDNYMLIWEPLLGFDANNKEYVNILADSYEMSPDGKTWTVKLIDAYWHDGQPVVAEDVAFTFAMHLQSGGTAGSQLTSLKGYQAVVDRTADRFEGIVCKDDKTVVFEFDAPNYLFESTLACHGFSILPAHCFEGLNADEVITSEYWAAPIGSGAYKMNEVAWPDYVTLTANDNWHGGTPGIKDIVLIRYTDWSIIPSDLMADNLEYFYGISEVNANTVTATNPNMTLVVEEAGYTLGLMVNQYDTARPEMRDARVRKAINMIIDKQMIADYIGVQASVATNYSAMDYNTDIPKWERDVEGGKKLLEEAGFDFSKPLRLWGTGTDQQTIDIFDIIVANMAEAGVTVEYSNGADDAITAIYETRDYDIYYCGTTGMNIDMYIGLTSGMIYDAWYYDEIADYRYERYQALFDQYRMTATAEGRTEILDQIQINAMEDMYAIPLWHRNSMLMHTSDLKGFTFWGSDFDSIAYFDYTQWYLDR